MTEVVEEDVTAEVEEQQEVEEAEEGAVPMEDEEEVVTKGSLGEILDSISVIRKYLTSQDVGYIRYIGNNFPYLKLKAMVQ